MTEKRRRAGRFGSGGRKAARRFACLLLFLACLLLFRAAEPEQFARLTSGLFRFEEQTSAANQSGSGFFAVHMIDIGVGDCFLLQSDGANMLIDAGEEDAGEIVLAYLAEQGVERLDAAVGTHAHSDHIGSMDRVLNEMPCDRFLLSETAESAAPASEDFRSLLAVLQEKRIPVQKVRAGTAFYLGEARVEILGPIKCYESLNDTSVVLRVTKGDTSFLFTGDMESQAEQDLLASGCDLHADVLKAGHHGSFTSTTGDFLQAVKPSLVLISANGGNPYGHPHPDVMETLKNAHIPCYLTRENGHVVVFSDGKDLTVQTEK